MKACVPRATRCSGISPTPDARSPSRSGRTIPARSGSRHPPKRRTACRADLQVRRTSAPIVYHSYGILIGDTMAPKTDVWQGTLALMVLKTLETMGPLHGYGIARRIEQTSGQLLSLNYGTLYPALVKLELD